MRQQQHSRTRTMGIGFSSMLLSMAIATQLMQLPSIVAEDIHAHGVVAGKGQLRGGRGARSNHSQNLVQTQTQQAAKTQDEHVHEHERRRRKLSENNAVDFFLTAQDKRANDNANANGQEQSENGAGPQSQNGQSQRENGLGAQAQSEAQSPDSQPQLVQEAAGISASEMNVPEDRPNNANANANANASQMRPTPTVKYAAPGASSSGGGNAVDHFLAGQDKKNANANANSQKGVTHQKEDTSVDYIPLFNNPPAGSAPAAGSPPPEESDTFIQESSSMESAPVQEPQAEEEYRIFIEYKPRTKGDIRRAIKDVALESMLVQETTPEGAVDAPEGSASGGNTNTNANAGNTNSQNPHIKQPLQVHFDFEEMNSYVLTVTRSQLIALGSKTGSDIVTVEIDPVRDLLTAPNGGRARRLEQIQNQYALDMIQAPEMWKLGATGQGVKVCVIDSGLDADNPEFTNTQVTGAELTRSISGIDANNFKWDEDLCYHGTHVAGTIAASKNDDQHEEGDVVGIAYNADIFVVPVITGSSCTGLDARYSSSLINAAIMCKDNGAQIINISLGGPFQNEPEKAKFKALFEDDGILTIAAAGNAGNTTSFGASTFIYPASYDTVLSVTAVDNSEEVAWFSKQNRHVDIAAPGSRIASVQSLDGSKLRSSIASDALVYSGTSMATPHVTGVAALLKSVFGSALTASHLRAALLSSAKSKGNDVASGEPQRNNAYGYGIVQAKAAYDCLLAGTCIMPAQDVCSDKLAYDGDEVGFAWYGSDGTTCQEYATFGGCPDYYEQADYYTNFDLTPNDACCACSDFDNNALRGGFTARVAPEIPPALSHEWAPSAQPSGLTMSPTRSPTHQPTTSPSASPTGYPTGQPTMAPSKAKVARVEWIALEQEDFAGGQFGQWRDGGSDVVMRSPGRHPFQNQGYAVRLRDNSSSSVLARRQPLDVSSYSSIQVQFTFQGKGMDARESFQLEACRIGGGDGATSSECMNRNSEAFAVEKIWLLGNDSTVSNFIQSNSLAPDANQIQGLQADNVAAFRNNIPYAGEVVTIDVNNTSEIQLQFRNNGSANSDKIFIKEINILAATASQAKETPFRL